MAKRKIQLELTKDEFDMIVDKMDWMRCIVRDSNNLNSEDYCNGQCGPECNRPDLCSFSGWFKSKIIEPNNRLQSN